MDFVMKFAKKLFSCKNVPAEQISRQNPDVADFSRCLNETLCICQRTTSADKIQF